MSRFRPSVGSGGHRRVPSTVGGRQTIVKKLSIHPAEKIEAVQSFLITIELWNRAHRS
jgi:hypothetical protein